MDHRSAIIIGTVIVLALALLGAWNFGPGRSPSVPANLTEITDPETIQHTVQLTHLSILTSDTFVETIRIRNITGVLTNISDKPIRRIDLKMTFSDSSGNMVEESTHTAFDPRRPPLVPGSEYRFEINFENLPKTWNYHVPKTGIVKVAF